MMKAIKHSQPGQPLSLSKNQIFKLPKSPLIRHCTELATFKECQNYIKRNDRSYKIDYQTEKGFTTFKYILKRNSKYLRTLVPRLRWFNPRLDVVKHLKSLRTIDLSETKEYSFPLISDMELERAHIFMNTIFRGGLIQEVRFNSFALLYCQRPDFTKLDKIRSLWVDFKSIPSCHWDFNEESLLTQLQGLIIKFRNLHSLSLDFGNLRANKTFLFKVFEKLSDLENLSCLRIHLLITSVISEPVNINKKIMQKFSGLLSLDLHLDLNENRECNPLLTKLLPLKNLQKLGLIVKSNNIQVNSDIPDFISSLKNLTSFQFSYNEFLHFPHDTIFQSLRKLKKLQKISYYQNNTSNFTYFFPFEVVNKTIQSLKELKVINIDLDKIFQKPRDIYFLFDFLDNNKSLEEVKVCLSANQGIIEEYFFDDYCYNHISSLISNLKVFKLKLNNFPKIAQQTIKQIFTDSNKDPKYFNCVVVG